MKNYALALFSLYFENYQLSLHMIWLFMFSFYEQHASLAMLKVSVRKAGVEAFNALRRTNFEAKPDPPHSTALHHQNSIASVIVTKRVNIELRYDLKGHRVQIGPVRGTPQSSGPDHVQLESVRLRCQLQWW